MKKFKKTVGAVPIVLTEEEKTIFSDHSRTKGAKKVKRKRSKKVNRQISGKKFFLTFPKCKVEPKVALQNLIFRYPCKWAVVSQENHLDGTPHIHAAFWLKNQVRYTDPKYLD